MKKIIASIAVILPLLTFGLMAEETTTNNTDIKRNSFSIDFGFANNDNRIIDTLTSSDKLSGYIKGKKTNSFNYNDLDAKANISFIYLRKLDMLKNKLSLGLEAQGFVMGTHKGTEYSEDSYGDVIYQEKNEFKFSYSIPFNLMLLSQVELIKLKQFDLSLQAGVGMALHYFSTERNISISANGIVSPMYSKEKSAYSATPSAKIALIGYYNINDSFAVGLSANYLYTGKPTFEFNESDSYEKVKEEITFKNKGTTTVNLSLKYSF